MAVGVDPPGNSHSPSPHSPVNVLSQLPILSPETPSPAPSPSFAFPHAPVPSDPSPALTNSSSPNKSPTSTPTLAAVSNVVGKDEVNMGNVGLKKDSSSDRRNVGEKAGVAIAVVAGACTIIYIHSPLQSTVDI
ncbi:unnamed protein product [Fraxinus pennsylvanica]|uniref:Uncharacterized protein n=1 Tax=Fraxinus pennsylvanica TaxID=56036 RepID=A0AAD1YWT0_9LAMI|nr:unnamed protein product [Fraxinus pennsylvanica]